MRSRPLASIGDFWQQVKNILKAKYRSYGAVCSPVPRSCLRTKILQGFQHGCLAMRLLRTLNISLASHACQHTGPSVQMFPLCFLCTTCPCLCLCALQLFHAAEHIARHCLPIEMKNWKSYKKICIYGERACAT